MLLVDCPICKKKIPYEKNPFRPFCSERCKTRDLGNWASEAYQVPGISTEEAEESPANLKEETS